MPLCPGCRRHVSYAELPAHEQYCRWIWGSDPVARGAWDDHLADAIQGLDDYAADVAAVARLERRVRRLESQVADDE